MRRAQQIISVAVVTYTLYIAIYLGRGISLQQPLWLFPGLYLVELIFLTLIAAGVSFFDVPVDSFILWISAGITLAFMILGAMSIGLFYFPTLVMLIVAATFSEFHHPGRIWLHVSSILLGAAFQTGVIVLVLWLIDIFPPGAIVH